MRSSAVAVLLLAAAVSLPADEGMWLFNQFPAERVKAKYNFEVTSQFLDQLRAASVRFNNGGSGSFISPHGLLFTNHHVGADCIQKLSSASHDYMAGGFYADTQAEERACPDLEVNKLLKIDDVTARITEGTAGKNPAAAERLRKANIAHAEKACSVETGNRCEVVPLFSGERYHMYQYHKYTDIRLVFAPEYDIAAFGKDPDNFTYPRYCLDFALFRAYENGKPAESGPYFRWNPRGARDHELIFVSGNPGSTGRLATVAELEFDRDVLYPLMLDHAKSIVHTLLDYSAESPEHARQAVEALESQQNTLKAFSGFERGLLDPALIAQKRTEEAGLRRKIDADPKLKAEFGGTWDRIAGAYREYRGIVVPLQLLEIRAPRASNLLRLARIVVRYAAETPKPNGERLREFRDSSLPAIRQQLASTAPIYKPLEIAMLSGYLSFLEQRLSPADPTVKAILAGKTPARAAADYVNSSHLDDPAARLKLSASEPAVESCADGMIRLALLLDKPALELRRQWEDTGNAVLVDAQAKVARARFVVDPHEYPDATFTLRLTYGEVKGYRNGKGKWVPWTTRLEGVYRKATGKDPYVLPPSWLKAKGVLDPVTSFNFVSTADTHGGNSGSPTLDRNARIVGILFDGNIEGLPNRFVYTEAQARSVHVSSWVILEALRKVYHADRIVTELGMPVEEGN
ncbi:MAG: S46 family peptidase [Bryobacterales bacterium]|nr:S46 family peptidase [Bryobacterales bacterium]